MMSQQKEKPNILIIDDDPDLLNMLELGLDKDFNVIALSQPEKALEILKSQDIDLVITDVMMPCVTGFEILRRVKEINDLVEVILLTGELPDKAKPAVTALQSGAHDYLLKPVKIWELKGAIQRALEKQRLRTENKRLIQELVRMANTDSLTGLGNRGNFYSQFYQEFERCSRYRRRVSCLILDVDKFKTVNDRYGHHYGDLVLERIGSLLMQHTRASDLKCRYGGDEFVLVLPEGRQEGALALAEKLRSLIANEIFDFPDQAFQVTVTFGVSVYEEGNYNSADEFLNAADLALLSAKHEGGNCVRSSLNSITLIPPSITLVNH